MDSRDSPKVEGLKAASYDWDYDEMPTIKDIDKREQLTDAVSIS
jgi:hypothetical protein